MKKIIKLLILSPLLLVFVTCDLRDAENRVLEVMLEQTSDTLTVGDSLQLSAVMIPADVANPNVTWSSSNIDVATVSNTGVVRPISPGSSIITVTTQDGGFTATSTITVNDLVNAQAPIITVHPQSVTYLQNATATALTVVANSPDGGTLSYQWYSNTTNSNTGGTAISGATSASFMPPTATVGTLYYYVVVTNTIPDNGDGGIKTATATSNVATVEITVTPAFVPVTNIMDVPTTATVGTPLTLTGTVVPSNATNQTIVWSVQDAGTTGASISGSTFNTTSAGSVTVRATIVNGLTETTNYTQDFPITVNQPFVPVTNITGVPTTATVGTPLTLTDTVVPSNATNQTIVWSVQDAGTTGASISGSTLSTTSSGTVTVRATITNGLTTTTNYTQNFTITVNVPMTGCNQNVPNWGSSLGVVTFHSQGHDVVISGNGITQTWSGAVTATNCQKDAFNSRLSPNDFNADCRSNPGFPGDLFSWCAVVRFADELCSAPWRVPKMQDFIDLDIAMGGNGQNRFQETVNGHTWQDQLGWYTGFWEGAFGGVCYSDNDMSGQGSSSAYWSQTEASTTGGFRLHFRTLGGIEPQTAANKGMGYTLRCVR